MNKNEKKYKLHVDSRYFKLGTRQADLLIFFFLTMILFCYHIPKL